MSDFKDINSNACSASCFGAFKWSGMTTNGGCRCLSNVDIPTKRQICMLIQAYKDKITELEEELFDNAIEVELDK